MLQTHQGEQKAGIDEYILLNDHFFQGTFSSGSYCHQVNPWGKWLVYHRDGSCSEYIHQLLTRHIDNRDVGLLIDYTPAINDQLVRGIFIHQHWLIVKVSRFKPG